MSLRGQTVINFSVRKSSRVTKKLNYNESQQQIHNSVISESIDSKSKSKTKHNEMKGKDKSEVKTRVRRHSATDDNDVKVDENKDKQSVSPSKVKKSSDDRHNISLVSKTKQLLSPSIVDSVIGRDSECEAIRQLVSRHLEARQAVSLYISGSAGTGKTLSVNEVMNRLKDFFDFKLISINCMSFRNSNAIYSKILNEFKHKKSSKPTDCLQAINGLLTDTKTPQMIVLVLDEIDQLLDSKGHEVLNTVFLWTKLNKSKLVLIGIANTLDLTTRMLSRIKSIGLTNVNELHFKPYTTQQIVDIIQDRIKRATEERSVVINPMAVQLCARKIGSLSGDIRKALDVCRRALDLIERKDNCVKPLMASNDNEFNTGSPKKSGQIAANCVDVPQIMSVLNQIYGQNLELNSNKCLPFNQQLILCSLLTLSKQNNRKEVKFSECQQMFVQISTKRGISFGDKNDGEFLSMCQLLEDTGFVSIKRDKNIRNSKISLKVDESDVEHSMNDQKLLQSILKQFL